MNMQVEPFLLAPALQLIIGQRLVRKLCPYCSKPQQASPEQDSEIRNTLSHLQKKDPKI
jgi:hypothetical protein